MGLLRWSLLSARLRGEGVRKLERALIDLKGGLPGDLPLELEALRNIRKNPRVEIGRI